MFTVYYQTFDYQTFDTQLDIQQWQYIPLYIVTYKTLHNDLKNVHVLFLNISFGTLYGLQICLNNAQLQRALLAKLRDTSDPKPQLTPVFQMGRIIPFTEEKFRKTQSVLILATT